MDKGVEQDALGASLRAKPRDNQGAIRVAAPMETVIPAAYFTRHCRDVVPGERWSWLSLGQQGVEGNFVQDLGTFWGDYSWLDGGPME